MLPENLGLDACRLSRVLRDACMHERRSINLQNCVHSAITHIHVECAFGNPVGKDRLKQQPVNPERGGGGAHPKMVWRYSLRYSRPWAIKEISHAKSQAVMLQPLHGGSLAVELSSSMTKEKCLHRILPSHSEIHRYICTQCILHMSRFAIMHDVVYTHDK